VLLCTSIVARLAGSLAILTSKVVSFGAALALSSAVYIAFGKTDSSLYAAVITFVGMATN
jgi:hypothetical protein